MKLKRLVREIGFWISTTFVNSDLDLLYYILY